MNFRLSACVTAIVLTVTGLVAETKPVPAAPIPPRVLAAKKVFIANGGQDERSPDGPQYSGNADRAYSQLFAALKSSGRYDLVSDPADADVVFEIEFVVEVIAPRGQGIIDASIFDPRFTLSIRDPKTNVLLWRFTEHAAWALLQGNRDRNFDGGLQKIVADVQALGGPTAVASN